MRRIVGLLLIAALSAPAEDLPKFEVASVKPSDPSSRPDSSVPVGPGDAVAPTGGLFRATNLPLTTYVIFAYRLAGAEAQSLLSQFPDWAKNAHFDIQARAPGNNSRPEMRLMMRSLLADRFRLAIHQETRELPVLALTLAKPGKPGPNLRPHSDTIPCEPNAPAYETTPQGLPMLCGNVLGTRPSSPELVKLIGRNVPMKMLLSALNYMANFGRPMVDRTGLDTGVDFTLEFRRDLTGPRTSPEPQDASVRRWSRPSWNSSAFD